MNRSTLGLADCRVLVAAGVLFMELTDATIILTALPSMAQSFGIPANTMSVAVTAYAVAAAAFIPASGWAADRVGARRLLIYALALFVGSSVMCAAAQTLGVLIAARVIQGVAGAMMVPVARLLVLADAEPHQIMRTIAILTWPALIAPLAAPVVGGVVTEFFGWRWIFLLNVPMGLLAIAAVFRVFQANDWPARPRTLDSTGLLFAALSAGGLVSTLDLAVRGSTLWVTALLATLVSFVLLAWRVTHTATPIINPALLSITTFAVSSAQSGALMRLAINAIPYLVPLMFQLVHGMGPAEAGGMLMVYMAGNIAMKPATTWILSRWSFRDVLSVNGVVSALAIAALALSDRAWSILVVAVVLFSAGLSRSLNFTATNTLAFADVASCQRSDASTLLSVLHQAMLSVGIGAAACLLAASGGLRGASEIAQEDFRFAFLAVGAAMVASTIGYFATLPREAGANLRR